MEHNFVKLEATVLDQGIFLRESIRSSLWEIRSPKESPTISHNDCFVTYLNVFQEYFPTNILSNILFKFEYYQSSIYTHSLHGLTNMLLGRALTRASFKRFGDISLRSHPKYREHLILSRWIVLSQKFLNINKFFLFINFPHFLFTLTLSLSEPQPCMCACEGLNSDVTEPFDLVKVWITVQAPSNIHFSY